jgi:hypothetical protein
MNELTPDEHKILVDAIQDSATVVHKGRKDMNEQIRLLVEQAVKEVDNPFPGNPLNDELEKMYIPDCFAEKFAELIIEKCLAQVRDEVQYISDCDKADQVINAVKKHFGVEV